MQTRLSWALVESAFGGSLKSGGRFCVLVFSRNLTCRREDVFTFNLLEKKFYKFCTFNAICNANDAKNSITVLFSYSSHVLYYTV
jgi:hypothetical protein